MKIIFEKPKFIISDSQILKAIEKCHHVSIESFEDLDGIVIMVPSIKEQVEDKYNFLHFCFHMAKELGLRYRNIEGD